jgi:S-adenosylmethionine-diacylglycerol 3-amino-3-carboxypropyl transferase
LSSEVELPRWVADAKKLPIAFAQVREDALLDLAVVKGLERPPRVAMVASGGCTAAALAGSGKVESLHLVDPNPAQLALSRLKLELLLAADPRSRSAILGHAPMPARQRQQALHEWLDRIETDAAALGPADVVAQVGPDHAGRYEQVFLALGASLKRTQPDLDALLCRSRPALGQALDAALMEVMALPNLVQLFGEDATRNPLMPFARHFAERVRWALVSLPAADNPYLWQMLLARYPAGVAAPWLSVEPPPAMPPVTSECQSMQAALEPRRDEFDFVHLSNILDWLTPERAAQTLEQSWRALRRGGCVLLRQLNSSLDLRSLDSRFQWDIEGARAMHQRDRSFFYRALHLGFKR